MKVAVIGAGSAGRRHIENILALGVPAEDVTAVDVNGSVLESLPGGVRLAKKWLGRRDAVVIATPWDRHLEFVERAVAESTPFLVEKPLGTLDELGRWRELAAGQLPVHSVGYMLRFHEKAQAMKALVPEPRVAHFELSAKMDQWPGKSYGPALVECSHEIDLALWMGMPTVDDAWGEPDADMTFTAGCFFVRMDPRGDEYLRAWSLNVEGDRQFCGASFYSPDELGTAMYRAELDHFLKAVREGKQYPPAATLRDGIRVLEVCAQVEQMARASA